MSNIADSRWTSRGIINYDSPFSLFRTPERFLAFALRYRERRRIRSALNCGNRTMEHAREKLNYIPAIVANTAPPLSPAPAFRLIPDAGVYPFKLKTCITISPFIIAINCCIPLRTVITKSRVQVFIFETKPGNILITSN